MTTQTAAAVIVASICLLGAAYPFLVRLADRAFGSQQNCPPLASNNLESRVRKQEIGMASVTTRLNSIDGSLGELKKSVGQIYDHLRNPGK